MKQHHLDPTSAHPVLHQTAELLARFYALKTNGQLNVERLRPLAASAVSNLFTYFQDTGNLLRDVVLLLSEMTVLEDAQLAKIGVEFLFTHLVEAVNDTFDTSRCSLYAPLFTQVISFYRSLSGGRTIDQKLLDFRLADEAAILHRYKKIQQLPHRHDFSRVKQILVLSRVTIGADVAITSVILARLRRQFPLARITLIGPPKLYQIFGGDASINLRALEYGRHGSLLSRLASWTELVDVVSSEVVGLHSDEFLIFDPDSRLTQLGLLPLLPPDVESRAYFLFPSRSIGGESDLSLGQLTSVWLNSIFRDNSQTMPYVSIPSEIDRTADRLISALRRDRTVHLTTISFGVGGNSRKRLSAAFEEELTLQLSQKSTIILDQGASPEEAAQVQLIQKAFQDRGLHTLELDEHRLSALPLGELRHVNLLCWRGGIGSLAALIQKSDFYVGYDSAGQHIAAALSVPSTTVFVHSASALFARRWKPYGIGHLQTILVNPETPPPAEEVVRRVVAQQTKSL